MAAPNTRRRARSTRTPADAVLDSGDTTLLDALDGLLNTGVVLNGDVVLGVAGVDLIYLRLSSLLCAVDRVLPEVPGLRPTNRPRRSRGPRPLRKP